MQSGQDPAYFWEITYREIDVILTASQKRDEDQAWLAAQYSAFAVHSPDKMPNPRSGKTSKEPSEEMKEAGAIAARATLIALSGGSSHG